MSSLREMDTDWLRERARMLRRSPGDDFPVRGVSGAALNMEELRQVEAELSRRWASSPA